MKIYTAVKIKRAPWPDDSMLVSGDALLPKYMTKSVFSSGVRANPTMLRWWSQRRSIVIPVFFVFLKTHLDDRQCLCKLSHNNFWFRSYSLPRSGEPRTQKLKSHQMRTQSLKVSPFKSWSRSVYCHACYAYCQEFLPCLFLPFRSIHLHFFQNLSQVFLLLAAANSGSSVGQQNKIGRRAGCRFPCWVPAEYK